jgi:TP53 regulating kinase and related kinases
MILGQGAEAIVSQNKEEVIKERFSKQYRLPHLDESLRKFRTRREAKILQRLDDIGFPSPKLKSFCDNRMSIVMDFVPGETLKDVLKRGDDYQQLAKEMGEKIGMLHEKHIVHGDLTTSNMLVHQESHEINFIDFGLSQFSEKVEDKAVDLFLLERSLASTHFELPLFDQVLAGYREGNPGFDDVLNRLEEVRKRGRNKSKQ